MKNDIKKLYDNRQKQHIHREYAFSTETFNAIKNIQRRYSYELGEDISVNMAVSLCALHYDQMMREGAL